YRRKFYLAVLDSTAAGNVREDVIEFLASRIVDVTALGPVKKDAEPTEEDVHEKALFLAAGALWRTERWLRDDESEPAEQLADRLSRILATAAVVHGWSQAVSGTAVYGRTRSGFVSVGECSRPVIWAVVEMALATRSHFVASIIFTL